MADKRRYCRGRTDRLSIIKANPYDLCLKSSKICLKYAFKGLKMPNLALLRLKNAYKSI
jgi:hypothetical protein